MCYKDLMEKLLVSIGDEITMIKKMIETIENQLEQVNDMTYYVEDKKNK